MNKGISDRLLELRADRIPFVRATVVRAQVPASAHAGDTAIVFGDGTIEGFVGGQCAETSVRTAALTALRDDETMLLRVLPDEQTGFPELPGALVVVNTCLSGGALEIFLEPMLPSPLVEVVGATPVADAIVAMADLLGYATGRSVVGVVSPEATAVVVASHGRDEQVSIRAALDADVPYIALVASRRRGQAVLDRTWTHRRRASPDQHARRPGYRRADRPRGGPVHPGRGHHRGAQTGPSGPDAFRFAANARHRTGDPSIPSAA